ncbi:MAG: transcriptional repressor [Bacteroidaceae bacterium]|nr:transcriptional repressor [Bacteroidaceae bacterium]
MAPMKDTDERLLKEEAHRMLTEYMSEHHQRKTPERYAVLDAVYSFEGLFDADQLYQRLEGEFRVSRASIYTTLDLLARIGLVVRNQMPSKVYYERNIPGQVHFYKACTECGKLERFNNDSIGRLLKEMPVKRFHPSMYALTVSGLCSKCLSNINRRKKRLDKKKLPKSKSEAVVKSNGDKEQGKDSVRDRKKTNKT